MRLEHHLASPRSIVPTLCVSIALAAVAPAQQMLHWVYGPSANARLGKSAILIPDQNADGYADVLAGAPGFNQERGAIYCISGAYLALGTGVQTIWSCVPTANAGDLFGYALADLGDMTGDGAHEYLVGEPGYDLPGQNDVGAVRIVNGTSHQVTSLCTGWETGCSFGFALAKCGASVVIGSPGPNCNSSRVSFVRISQLTNTHTIGSISQGSFGGSGADEYGSSIAGGFDINGDGQEDWACGAAGTGSIGIGTLSPTGSQNILGSYHTFAGERLGASVDSGFDYDGDGILDVVAGAPNSLDAAGGESGRVVVLSGAHLISNTTPHEIHTFTHPNAGYGEDLHFGAAVRACADLNADGVGDILVGAPELVTYSGTVGQLKGNLSIYSGASGARWLGINGAWGDHFGDAITGSVGDLDGDGFPEFVVSGSQANITLGPASVGVIKSFRLFPLAPATYCTAKVNSLGCTPAISFSGTAKANPTAPFNVTASNFINQKTGLLFYSHTPASTAFQGGFKCAGDPVRRSGALNSGGSTSGSSCTGTYSLDFNARIASGIDPSLVAGAEIYAQYWSRDPLSASHTSLSNALRFLIQP